MDFTYQQIKEMEDIVAIRIPLGKVNSKCHVGICSVQQCQRCQDAVKIHAFFDKLMIETTK